jgi:hypothetical protein
MRSPVSTDACGKRDNWLSAHLNRLHRRKLEPLHEVHRDPAQMFEHFLALHMLDDQLATQGVAAAQRLRRRGGIQGRRADLDELRGERFEKRKGRIAAK